jgi:hypothetical protein
MGEDFLTQRRKEDAKKNLIAFAPLRPLGVFA